MLFKIVRKKSPKKYPVPLGNTWRIKDDAEVLTYLNPTLCVRHASTITKGEPLLALNVVEITLDAISTWSVGNS